MMEPALTSIAYLVHIEYINSMSHNLFHRMNMSTQYWFEDHHAICLQDNAETQWHRKATGLNIADLARYTPYATITQQMHHLLRLSLLCLTELSSSLGNDSLLLSLTGSLGLRTLGIHLLLQNSLTRLLGLGSVDLVGCVSLWHMLNPMRTYVLNQCSLVLESVTLAQVVEFMVKVLVDLAAGTVLDQEATEDTETAHPDNLAVDMD
jgi:hypothetical protein